MLEDRIEHKWIALFAEVIGRCAVRPGDEVAILSESQSRPLNVHLAELALGSLGARPFHVVVPSPPQESSIPIRSTGASRALSGQSAALKSLSAVPLIVDLTVEGLMHARELPHLLGAGARVLTISNEHPDALERLAPRDEDKERVRAAVARLRQSTEMTVLSEAGTDLKVNMSGASTVGIWGWTDRPGTLAHWPAGLVVSFPESGGVNGTLVLDAGDINLTFKRYLSAPVRLRLEDDFVTRIDGSGTDAELMRRYLAAFKDPLAYATSHVGFGLNEAARYEALTMYDQRETNGTEARAHAGNFLYSTGTNEFANRFTEGHFDLPVRGCTIALDGAVVIDKGTLTEALP